MIDPSTNTIEDTITVGSFPIGVAVGPTGPDAGDVYVTNALSNNVSAIEP